MATFAPRRFSSAAVLSSILPARLKQLLRPFRQFLTSRGFTWPASGTNEVLDCDELAEIFLTPSADTPKELIDALYIIDEMATEDGMDSLLTEAKERRIALPTTADSTPADIAVMMWLADKESMERKHAEQCLWKVRSFDSYQMDRVRIPSFRRPSKKQLLTFAERLDEWFEERQRGRGSRVSMCERDGEIWFIIKHGDPFKREESLDGKKLSSVSYRPVKPDVLVYLPRTGELRINARTIGEKDLYRTEFGKLFFADSNIFPRAQKFTLEPLREDGEDSLSLADVDGIEWIRLREIHFSIGGEPNEIRIHKSSDIFALFQERNRSFPSRARIVKATLQVKFSDSKTPRSLIIKPPNVAQFTRDRDSALLEQWLQARGFVVNAEDQESDQDDKVLAGD